MNPPDPIDAPSCSLIILEPPDPSSSSTLPASSSSSRSPVDATVCGGIGRHVVWASWKGKDSRGGAGGEEPQPYDRLAHMETISLPCASGRFLSGSCSCPLTLSAHTSQNTSHLMPLLKLKGTVIPMQRQHRTRMSAVPVHLDRCQRLPAGGTISVQRDGLDAGEGGTTYRGCSNGIG